MACSFYAEGQQLYHFTHYMMNDFVYNPAVAGSRGSDISARFNFRKQWVGFDEGSPSTQYLSAHSNFGKDDQRNVGLGAIFYNDKTGPTSRMGMQLAYAYHIPLTDYGDDDTYLSFGISGLLMQQSVNFSELEAYDVVDPTLSGEDLSKMGFDSNFGAYLYKKGSEVENGYWFGLAAAQLFSTKFDLNDQEALRNKMHIFGSMGYRINIDNDLFAIEPNVFFKAVQGAPAQFDFGARFIYDESYWIGASFRTEDAFSVILGIDYNDALHLAYSYDFTTSALKNYSNGTHEISIGIDIVKGQSFTDKKL